MFVMYFLYNFHKEHNISMHNDVVREELKQMHEKETIGQDA